MTASTVLTLNTTTVNLVRLQRQVAVEEIRAAPELEQGRHQHETDGKRRQHDMQQAEQPDHEAVP